MDRRQFLGLMAALGVASALLGCDGSDGEGTDYSGVITEMKPWIEARMAAAGVPGMAVALVDGQDTVWAEGFGWADQDARIPAEAGTVFEIASVSKVVSATMVMQLVERGLVDLEAPLSKYLPDFSIGAPLGFGAGSVQAGGAITVRSVLTHHSGIPGDLNNGAMTTVPNYPGFNDGLLACVARDTASWPVNTVQAYSNTGMALLSSLVAAVTGRDFKGYSAEFLRSLGMTSSSYFLETLPDPSRMAKGSMGDQRLSPLHLNVSTAGSLHSSVTDLACFMRVVIGGGSIGSTRVLSPETLQAMLTRQNGGVALDFDTSTGLAWDLSKGEMNYAGRLCTHDGASFLFTSDLMVLLDHGLGAVALCNTSSGGTVVAETVHELLRRALQAKAGIAPRVPVPAPSAVVTRTQAELQALSGTYVVPESGWHTVAAAGDGLDLRLNDHAGALATEVRLVPRANGYYSTADSQDVQYEFKSVSGYFVLVRHEKGLAKLAAVRTVAPATLPAAWAAKSGDWAQCNVAPNDVTEFLGVTDQLVASLWVEGGMLRLKTTQGYFILDPIDDSVCRVTGLGRNQGNSVRAVTVGGEERLRFLDLELRRKS